MRVLHVAPAVSLKLSRARALPHHRSGKSNAYEINEKSELAAKYPGPCPLEMHHTATCLAAMEASELLSGLPQEAADLIQSVVVDCIMA